jgi:hypothetical protein
MFGLAGGDRRFRHITRARDHRDVPRDAAESLKATALPAKCTSKSRSREIECGDGGGLGCPLVPPARHDILSSQSPNAI